MIANNILYKGQIFKFSTNDSSLNEVVIGFDWLINKINEAEIDIEILTFLLNDNGKIPSNEFVVFYGSDLITISKNGNRPFSRDASVIGTLLSKEKEGNGDLAQIYLNLGQVNEEIQKIIVAITLIKYPHDKNKDKNTIEHNFSALKKLSVFGYDYIQGDKIFTHFIDSNLYKEDVIEIGAFVKNGSNWEFKLLSNSYEGGIDELFFKYT